MEDSTRYYINRSVVVLLPKQSAFDWIVRVFSNPAIVTLDRLRKEPNAFLVRGVPTDFPGDAERWIDCQWEMFFEAFIGDWCEDESMWPQHRTLAMFRDWFDFQCSPIAWDLANEPILRLDTD